jgi:hypothetical protein
MVRSGLRIVQVAKSIPVANFHGYAANLTSHALSAGYFAKKGLKQLKYLSGRKEP